MRGSGITTLIDGVHPSRKRSLLRQIHHLNELWECPDETRAVRIAPGNRLRSSLAVCNPNRGLIRVRPDVLTGPMTVLREVLCHEYAHLMVRWIHGSGPRPHGREWADLMRAAGYTPRLRMPMTRKGGAPTSEGKRSRVRYLHRCPACHTERLSPRPQPRWRCAHCRQAGLDGRLLIVSVGTQRGATP